MTKNLETQELTARSLNKLFLNHWTDVYSFAKTKTKDLHTAEDLTCETFIKAFIKIESYNPNKRFKPWIIKICKNTFIDSFRKRNRNISYLEDHPNFSVSDNALSPADQMILNEEYSDTLKKINFLGAGEKQIITLYYLDNLSYSEISKKLKITEGTARTRLSRAMMLKINSLSEKISFVTTLSFPLQV